MAELIGPGAWWLHSARGSNVYLVEAADGRLALIDTGYGSSAGAVVAEIESVAKGRGLSHILLTHGHADHSGAAKEIQGATGATLAVGRDDCSERRDGTWVLSTTPGRTHLARRIARLLRHQRLAETTVGTTLMGEVEVLPGLRAVPVPGHTPGSYCFVAEASGIAFVGDLVIVHGQRLARPLRWANRDDALYLRSLAEFAVDAPQAGCAGHGPPVMTGFAEALRELAAMPRGARSDGESWFGALRRRAKLLGSFGTAIGKRRADR